MRDLFRGANQQEAIRQVQACHVPPIDRIREDIPANLEAVMRRGLARDRQDRYPSADAFEKALVACCPHGNFEVVQAAAARFLTKHDNLFFAGVQGHKFPAGLPPEDTQKILLKAGPVPSIDCILVPDAVKTPVDPPDQGMAPPAQARRQRWVAVALASVLSAMALFLLLWEPALDTSPEDDETFEAAAPAASPNQQILPQAAPTFQAVAVPNSEVHLKRDSSAGDPGPNEIFAGSSAQEPMIRTPGMPQSTSATTPEFPHSQLQSQSAPDTTLLLLQQPDAEPVMLQEPSAGPAPTPSAIAKEPPALVPGEVHRFFRRHQATLMRCFDQALAPTHQDIVIAIEPGGTLEAVKADEQLGRFAACFKARLRRLRFRTFSGAPAKYILTVHVGLGSEPAQRTW